MHTKRLEEIHLSEIVPNRYQPRIHFDEEKIENLAKSIMTYGVLEPIIVRPLSDKYEIIAGERRFKASKLAGKSTIPAIIVDFNDKESIELALLENVQRQELTAIEEAIAYRRILDMGKVTQEELAKKIGKSQPAIANKMRLLALDDETQDALIHHKISERHARSLLKLAGTDEELDMLDRIIDERLTVRDTDREIAKLLEKGIDKNNKLDSFLSQSSKKIETKSNEIKKTDIEELKTKKEKKGEDYFMDIERIMQEAQDINVTEQPKDLNKFITPASYDNILENEQPVAKTNDIADIMSNQPEDQNKFINIAPTEEKEEQKENTEHPTVTFDNVFNATFDVPVIETPVSKEPELSKIPSLEESYNPAEVTVSLENTIPAEPVNLPTPEPSVEPVIETASPMDFTPEPEVETPNFVNEINDFPSIEEPVISEVQMPINPIDSGITQDDIPEFTSTIAEAAPNFENEVPKLSESVETPVSLPETLPTSSEINLENMPEVKPEVSPYSLIESLDFDEVKPNLEETQKEPAAVEPLKNDFSKVIDIIKNCSEQIKALGYEVSLNDFDLENIYQATIMVNK